MILCLLPYFIKYKKVLPLGNSQYCTQDLKASRKNNCCEAFFSFIRQFNF